MSDGSLAEASFMPMFAAPDEPKPCTTFARRSGMALKTRMPLSAPTCAPVATFFAVGVDRQSGAAAICRLTAAFGSSCAGGGRWSEVFERVVSHSA